ncbi:MAG: undecaprenyl-phosphate glucose phosphotransferase [Gammaproteobacteria bacterium]|nr:undecaprenyl-phosphate glucose phosphotransferase [Gammaproteobacteria bacterium]
MEADKIAVLEGRRQVAPDGSLRRRRVRIGSAHTPLHSLLHHVLQPLLAALTLLLAMYLLGERLGAMHCTLGLVTFLAGRQLLTPLPAWANSGVPAWLRATLPRLLLEWACVVAVLVAIGAAMRIPVLLSTTLLVLWTVLSLVSMICGRLARAELVMMMNGGSADVRRYVIVGANELGLELQHRAGMLPDRQFIGFFDDRSASRLPAECHAMLRGRLPQLREFVRQQAIDAVYITLPVATNERVLNLIRELRDTTVSVYVVPVIMALDTIQPRMLEIDGLPVVSIYDTPLHGSNALGKRALDICGSLLALLVSWPLLLAIGGAIKLTSPGPALFRQRRYGLHGEEFHVYKFRTMRVCEDGSKVTQATRNDSRVTRLGAFLRRTSLDELPQIVNVLQGRMSLVGPRPHAVAHNEQYRTLIDGYMFRHKVRPGITGWAQVNGQRGETETVDIMQARVDLDLEYLRNWSLWLDLRILLRTVGLLFGDAKAY